MYVDRIQVKRHFAIFREANHGSLWVISADTLEELKIAMANHVRSFFPNPDDIGRGDEEVLANFAKDHRHIGWFLKGEEEG